jgi:curved DNA-binding protein CbpA
MLGNFQQCELRIELDASAAAIGEAYEVLSDTTKRAQYDEYSKFWKQKGF